MKYKGASEAPPPHLKPEKQQGGWVGKKEQMPVLKRLTSSIHITLCCARGSESQAQAKEKLYICSKGTNVHIKSCK